jgi:peroxiredoxin
VKIGRRAFLLVMMLIGGFPLAVLNAQSLPSSPSHCSPCQSFGIQRITERKEAPFFNLKRVDGTFANLRDLKGKPTLLFFWATWCPACKEEIALLEKFIKDQGDSLSIWTLVIDGESEKAVQKTIARYRITLPVLLDVKEKVARNYGVRMVPTAYLLSEEGLIVGVIVGQRNWLSPEASMAIKELFQLR